ncbi:MAG: GGDEF domain-containing protein [Gemmatimonadota bacterium]|nr:GGDEF domain-containing protein [Gemmatimonadota bacterium]MDH3427462.1 GGDEF domain-containing protein [Gemmatimonadota bacterium]
MINAISVTKRFWRPPDATLMAPAAEGELIISRIRSILAILGLGIALVAALRHPNSADLRIYQAMLTLFVAMSLVLHLLVRRVAYSWWVGFVASIADVSVISLALAVFLMLGSHQMAVHNEILFPAYFYALSVTTVRLDHRACFIAGACASLQYIGLVALAGSVFQLGPEDLQVEAQAVRVALLIGMSGLGVLVNLRMQRPHVLSANDPLTGLLNRRAFMERWESEQARARRYGRPISIAVIDVDYFKQFNDRYGHAGGDSALVAVAAALRGRVRETDFVGRLGGEEFVVAFPETGSSASLVAAEGVRQAIENSPLVIAGARGGAHVTVSIGVASWPEHGEEISRLLDRADDRMYEAKLAGKNQVVGPAQQGTPLGAPVPY